MSIENNPFIGVAHDDLGNEYSATNDFFNDLDIYSEAVLADAQSATSPTFGRTDALYDSSHQFLEFLQDANQGFFSTIDTNQLNSNMKSYLGDLETLTSITVNTDTIEGEGSVDLMLGLAQGANNIADQVVGTGVSLDDQMSEASSSSAGSSGAGTYDLSAAQAAIDKASAAETSGEKAGFLADAIDAVIAALTGGGEGGAPGNGGSGVSSDDETPGDGNGLTNASSAGSGSGGSASSFEPPEPQIVTETFTGDELMGKLNAGGKGLTFDESDNGIGVDGGEDDEIDGQEYMTFNAGETVQGGEVVLEDLFGSKGGKGQEVATIEVMNNGEVVDTIQVNGDIDGQQAVQIDQPFDELKFTVDSQNGDSEGSFAISSVSVDREESVSGAGGGQGVSANQELSISEQGLAGILQALGQVLGNLDGLDLSETEKEQLSDTIQALMQSVIDNLQGDTLGSPEITGQEFAALMGQLENVLRDVKALAPEDDTSLNAALQALGEAMSALFAEVQGQDGTPSDEQEPETLLV